MTTTHTYFALPTGKRINPSAPETAYYYTPGQVHYILKIDGKLRDYTSYGTFGGVNVGDFIEMMHNSGRWIGMAQVVGIIPAHGDPLGDIPTKNIPHWVAK